MSIAEVSCPACGAPGSGAFCAACGAPRGSRWCSSCGQAVKASDRFCSVCGGPAAAGLVGRPSQRAANGPNWAYLIVGVVVLGSLLVAVMSRSGGRPVAPPTSQPSAAAAVDIASMTPRERFDRLYDRIMRAFEGGDSTAVMQFAPMALAAYVQLDTVDIDARYHAAMIRMYSGDMAGAASLADSIRLESPSHLFSFVINGTLAARRADTRALQRERAGFMANYQSEMAKELSEYSQHAAILGQFIAEARTGSP